ncbi:MAG: hypothetical protein UV58_C0006G0023 [Candidatus Wolfebacteria bacterium GW2011_GWC1_43_10]|uniref:Chloroplast import component protein (Tic20) n=2 Tax=Candidatus Wolfeibacteriota TaxID=1752735 RepID=A0A0G1CBE9_9BACT|nr:MAG: hypothetical protein UV58_C0006G0023 [Candidatus Wolfebacteria bacterium GW2011_GWC1_43_10]KKT22929.1 MAG: hypothetical protein UW08_C0002G0058 [Parcubacteria group bacterium GW2011_GWB1_43_8b]OGM89958.1 MAG: hypothetical protein A2108_02285 [Candidatus Wolfebacteria bacterium GWA1_42_9]
MEKHREKEGAVHHQESKGEKKNIGMAIVAYILFFVPLLTDDKNDPFVRYHVRQGLAFLIAAIIVGIFGTFVPIIGWILFFPLQLILLVIWIMGVVHAAKGEEKPLPIIGKFGEGLKI